MLAGARIAELLGPVTPALQAVAVIVLFGIAIRGVYLALFHARIGISSNAELPGQPLQTYLRFLAITLLNPTTILYFHQRLPWKAQLGLSLLGNAVVAGFAIVILRSM